MSVATLVNDFARDFRPPPAVDWATFLIGDDLEHLEKMVDRFEKDAIDWCAMLQSRIVALLDSVKAADAVNRCARAWRRSDQVPASSSSGRTMSARSGTGLTSAGDGSCIPAMTAMRSERAGVRCSA